MITSNNELSHDDKIALSLTAALLQAKPDGNIREEDLQNAYRLYKSLANIISSSPESRARRGFTS
mgnify:CR=1 FL=1